VSPVVDILLILALLIAALAWVLIYFFVVERWLQRHIGNIFGVTIGKSRLMERRQDAHTQFYVSGWKIVAPQSAGCMFDIFIWFVGGVTRMLVIGMPVAALAMPAVYLFYLVVRA